jgi:hypothetical protein
MADYYQRIGTGAVIRYIQRTAPDGTIYYARVVSAHAGSATGSDYAQQIGPNGSIHYRQFSDTGTPYVARIVHVANGGS